MTRREPKKYMKGKIKNKGKEWEREEKNNQKDKKSAGSRIVFNVISRLLVVTLIIKHRTLKTYREWRYNSMYF